MRSVFRRVAAIIRAAMAGVAHVALMPVRLVDGTIGWVIKAMQPPAALDFEGIEETAPAAPQQQPALSVDDRHREIGLRVKALVEDSLSHRKLAEDELGLWVRSLSAPALAAIVAADPMTVGRHLAGMSTMTTEYNIRINRPDIVRDRLKYRERLEEVRRNTHQAAADRRSERRRINPETAHRLIPSLGI